MPINASWLVEPNIRYHRYSGKVSKIDFEAFVMGELSFLDASDHMLFYISDFTQVEAISLNFSQLPTAVEFIRHAHFGAVAFIGVPAFLAFWANPFNKVSNFKLLKAGTVDDGKLMLLRLIDQQLAQKQLGTRAPMP
jgi:hypothetical protein